MAKDELKLCRCGGRARMREELQNRRSPNKGKWYWIECRNKFSTRYECNNYTKKYDTLQKTIEVWNSWNTRSFDTEQILADDSFPRKNGFIIETTSLSEQAEKDEQNKELQAENDKMKYVLSMFEGWHSEENCPYTESQSDFCPCLDELKDNHEKEMSKLCEKDRYDFSPTEDCENQNSEGYCYARYYESLFEKSKNKKEN